MPVPRSEYLWSPFVPCSVPLDVSDERLVRVSCASGGPECRLGRSRPVAVPLTPWWLGCGEKGSSLGVRVELSAVSWFLESGICLFFFSQSGGIERKRLRPPFWNDLLPSLAFWSAMLRSATVPRRSDRASAPFVPASPYRGLGCGKGGGAAGGGPRQAPERPEGGAFGVRARGHRGGAGGGDGPEGFGGGCWVWGSVGGGSGGLLIGYRAQCQVSIRRRLLL